MFSVLNIANVVVEFDVEPVFHDFIIQDLKLVDSLILAIQVVSILTDLAHNFLILIFHHLQSVNLLGVKVGTNTMVTDVLLES